MTIENNGASGAVPVAQSNDTPSKQDVIEWDVVNWSRALDFWESNARLNAGAEALEVGSRNGGLASWLAAKSINVLCTDLDGPTPHAVIRHAQMSFGHRIRYAALDCTDIKYTNQFDLIIFKSVLGRVGANDNVERMALAMQQFHKALKPGGQLLFAENLHGLPAYRAIRAKYVSWNDIWHYVSLDEMLEFLSIFSSVQYSTTGVLSLLGRSESQRNILGKIDQLALSRMIPSRWHNIMFGVATK